MSEDKKYRYETVLELREAILRGDVDPAKCWTFNNKNELYVHGPADEQSPDYARLFTEYYGTNNACSDICALLGLPDPEDV
jgi:hypothetical protein